MIRAIDGRTVERIAAGQVITDLASAIKELVENALDADATSIEIFLTGDGIDSFEVSDNGHGMGAEELKALGPAHCTSKLSSFEELESVSSLGFRGEAFHSLCALSQSVHVSSKTTDAAVGLEAAYSPSGKLNGPLKPKACAVGTRIKVCGLFHAYPVRLRAWQKESRAAVLRCVRLMQAYALGFSSFKLRMMSAGKVLLATSGSGSIRVGLGEVFGADQSCSGDYTLLADLKLALDDAGVSVSGAVGGQRRSTSDRQFIFVNGHPSEQRAIQKACNEPFRAMGIVDSFPVLVLRIDVDPSRCDINLTPDKRSITLFDETSIAEALREAVRDAIFTKIQTQPSLIQSRLDPVKRCCPVVEDVIEEDPIEKETSSTEELDTQQLIAEQAVSIFLSDQVTDSLSKEDFLEMQVIGQFNCGFILARLQRVNDVLLYIIDQHAADERFRLESLERALKPAVQQLMTPKALQLSVDDRLKLEGCKDEMAAMGFHIGSEGSTLLLGAVPTIAGVTLDAVDLMDVLHSSGESASRLARCPRVAAALASRACRSAIMIGAPLTMAQMSTVLRNLAGLDRPWICAHGRPTCRLLCRE